MLKKMEVVKMEMIVGGADIFDPSNYGSYPRENGSTAYYQPAIGSPNYVVYTTSGSLIPTGGSGPSKVTKADPTGGASIDFDQQFQWKRTVQTPEQLAKDQWRAGEHQNY